MKSDRLFSAWMAVCVIAAILIIVVATRHGIGLSPDSSSYIGGAQSLASGYGFRLFPDSEPITHHAPFYAITLAFVSFTGIDAAQSATWVNAALFSLNITLIYLLSLGSAVVKKQSSKWIAGGLASFALISIPLVEVHLMAWSEALYLSLMMGSIWYVAGYMQTSARSRLLVSAVLTGLAILTRYAGVSLWAGICLAIILFGKNNFRRKLSDLTLYSTLSILPIVLWSMRNVLVADTAFNRSIVFHPVSLGRFHQGLVTLSTWLLIPAQTSTWIKTILIGAVLIIFILVIGRWVVFRSKFEPSNLDSKSPYLFQVSLITGIVYLLFLVFSSSFIDANTPFDQRILSPIFVLSLTWVAFSLSIVGEPTHQQKIFKALLTGILLLGMVGHGSYSLRLIRQSYEEGIGFNNSRWRNSQLIHDLKTMQTGMRIYTNSPDAVFFYTGMDASRLPSQFLSVTQQPNPYFQADVQKMQQDLENDAILIYFNLGQTGVSAAQEELIQDLGLTVLAQYPDGMIYVR